MPRKDRTVADACRSWLKACERNGLERSTMKAYRSHVFQHIEPRIGDILLTDLTKGDVRDFQDEMQDAGCSLTLVRKVTVSLRSVLSEAVEREWVDRNVAADLRRRRSSRQSKQEKVIPSKEEIRRIINEAPESHRTMFVTAIYTGMRISELRGLTWDAVDFEQQRIRVYQRADETCELGAPKSSAGSRTIPMAPTVMTMLRDWKGRAPESAQDLVFPNSVGNIQNYSNIYNRVFKPMLVELEITDEAGKPRFGIHALRHAAASLFIEQGWNPKKIQTLLGHASITMTMDTYGHLFENAAEDVAMFEKLDSDLLAA